MKRLTQNNFVSKNVGSIIVFVVSSLIFGSAFSIFFYAVHKDLATSRTYATSGDIAWPVFDGGVDDSGSNTNETIITTSNVSSLYNLWQASLPAVADNAVVEQPNVTTSQGVMDLVIVNTIKGNLIAYNSATGAKIWEADPSSADFNGQGTKSTPAIDPSGNYVYAYADDGYIHKYNITNGAEVTGTGFPAQATLLPNNIEKGSASLNIANGYLYMTFSGNDGDYGHYVGHVVAINLSSGVKTVWNAECSNLHELLDATSTDPNYCSDTESGIWARPGVKVDPVTGNVFVATGNGLYNANSGGYDWGDSLVELKPDLSQIVDSYTPSTYASLQSGDADLGSTAPAILPTQSSSSTPYMLAQAGKDHILRLLNRSNLSGSGGPGHTGGELQTITLSGEVHEQPAVWVDGSNNTWVFVTDDSGDFYAFKLVTTSGSSKLVQQYTESIGTSSSPFVANGIVYISGNNLLALNATTGAQLYSSSISLSQHWESPVVVNGMVFTPDDNGNLYAFTVPTKPVVSFTATPQLVPSGGVTTLSWSASNASSCSATAPGGFSISGTSGTSLQSPSSTTAYTISCTGSGGTTSASINITVSPPSSLLPLYRLVSLDGDHLYTASSLEVSSAIKWGGYSLEGIAAFVSRTSGTGLTPLYRLRSPNGFHFYTQNQSEEQTVTASDGYTLEGIAGYVDLSSGSGLASLYRLRSPSGVHFYTANPAEESYLVTVAGFVLEGTAGYVTDTTGSQLSPLYRLYSNTNDHFYTTNPLEVTSADKSFGYSLEGIGAFVNTASSTGLTPLYRLRSGSYHFYTQSAAEESSAVTNYGYVLEGTAAYVNTSSNASSATLYRLRAPTGQHFYTISSAEESALVTNDQYVLEPSAGYVYALP